jgi:hypothetical protein
VTWTRLDDSWSERRDLGNLPVHVRWHYLAMIQFCSRTDRVDGLIRRRDAQRCSDVDDVDAALADLVAAGFLTTEGASFRVVEIDSHVPPPYVRKSAEQARVRKQRSRAHKSGDHSLCREHCEVTGDVTRDPGTGQDGTGQPRRKAEEGGDDDEADRAFIKQLATSRSIVAS